MNLRLRGTFALRSPLSHISESISTTAYLVEEPVVQAGGGLANIFCYSGNAWRGQLRDLAASYMLDALGGGEPARLPIDLFHLLFSGGRLGGKSETDIEAARRLRAAVPMLAVWGGGVGTQILGGKMRVSNCYPICREAARLLPESLADEAAAVSYSDLTFEKSFSRRDDAKIVSLAGYIAPPATLQLEGGGGPKKKAATTDAVPDQMRMTVELVAAGARLYTEIDFLDVSEVELGAAVSALHSFSRSPHIGGQSSRGHGKVALTYDFLDMDTGETGGFVVAGDGPALLSPRAGAAKDAYDGRLREMYDEYLSAHAGDIRKMLGSA